MQREIDDLRNREQAGQRKLELETQGLHALELRLKESKALMESRDRELSRREQLTDEKYNECVERAKLEARASLRTELDAIQRERSEMSLDRQHLQDDMTSQGALLDSAKTTRRMLKEAQAELLLRDDEIEALTELASSGRHGILIEIQPEPEAQKGEPENGQEADLEAGQAE